MATMGREGRMVEDYARNSAEIPNDDLHGHAHRTLSLTRYVLRQPAMG